VSEPAPPPPLRIGTAERNAAMAALDAHLEAGRLDPVEYGERSARITDARTVDDLLPLFDDLPAPHPDLPGARSPVAADTGAGTAAVRRNGSSALEQWGPRVAAAMPILALVLFLTVPVPHAWLFFLLIPLAGALVRPGHRDRDRRRDRDRDRDRDEGPADDDRPDRR